MDYRVEFVEDQAIVQESAWALVVNGMPWVTLMCTPEKLDHLALGFLANEGVIQAMADVASVEVHSGTGQAIHVQLHRDDLRLPRRRTVTSGCVGGVTFGDLAGSYHPLNTHQTITPLQVFSMMEAMRAGAVKYRQTRGLHCSALAGRSGILAMAEDVGRHNTLDKIRGACLVQNIRTHGRILLTTGRFSSEMLHKAMRMGTPIALSRSSPTDLSIQLARRWGITLIGYVRGRKMSVYSGAERVITPETEEVFSCAT